MTFNAEHAVPLSIQFKSHKSLKGREHKEQCNIEDFCERMWLQNLLITSLEPHPENSE